MTPANIAGMAAVKGLDVIAVTDHNSCRNCAPTMKMAEEYGVIALPGMELCTEEEVHVVCLFPDLYTAMDFDGYVYDKMLKIPNKEKIFGEQLLYNDIDDIIGKEPNLLLCNTSIRFDEVFALTEERNGIMIAAHIDKTTNSLIANLGFIPPDSQFTCAEVKDLNKLSGLLDTHLYLSRCRIISNSDAHYLEHIHEPEHTIDVAGLSAAEIIKALKFKDKE